jgi:hypothetical protein
MIPCPSTLNFAKGGTMQALEQLKTYWGKHEGEPGWGRLGRSGDGA